MDIFDKIGRFTIARDYREMGIYPYFHALESRQDTEVIMEGKRRIMLGSNNYLGLTTEPSVTIRRPASSGMRLRMLSNSAMSLCL